MIRLIIEVPQFIMIIIDGEPEETPKIFNYYSEPFRHSRESWQGRKRCGVLGLSVQV